MPTKSSRPGTSTLRRTLLSAVVIASACVAASPVFAQPIGGAGMGGGAPTGEPEKPEGVAEQAPKKPGLLTTTLTLPAPRNPRKRWKLLEMNGYYRLRTQWFKNFSQGFLSDPALGGAPYARPIGCNSSAVTGAPCDDNSQSANMRLRLEPTFNLSEGTAVHTQIDLLDNAVLGSAPDREAPGAGQLTAASDGQGTVANSILVRQAWAEVALPLGTFKFGRMPNSWGMGMMNNAGGADPLTGLYDTNADYGDTVDRAQLSAQIPGTTLRAALSADWPSTTLISTQTAAGNGRGGQPWDLDDNDDVNQYVLTISRVDAPDVFADTAARGDFAANWGVYFGYRTQSWVNNLSAFTEGGELDPSAFVARNYKTYNPNVWLKLGYKSLVFELEATAVVGSVGKIDDLDAALTQSVDIRQFGGVARLGYTGLGGKLRLGLESGFASGDQWDNTPEGSLHVSQANFLGGAGDNTLSKFAFDRNYTVDLILFRQLYGAVTNAVYAKPFFAYDVTKSITVKVSNVTSFALKPVATPGNDSALGVEFDSEIGYRNGGFFAGITYGVLFPLGGLDHPANGGFSYDATNTGEAGTSHAIQSRFVLQF